MDKEKRFLATQAKDDAQHYEHYEHYELGYNYRRSNVLAAIGVTQREVWDKQYWDKQCKPSDVTGRVDAPLNVFQLITCALQIFLLMFNIRLCQWSFVQPVFQKGQCYLPVLDLQLNAGEAIRTNVAE